MKRLLGAAAALAVWSGAAIAADLPDYDAFHESTSTRPVPGPLSPATKQLVSLGQIAHVEERLGVPTFFWAAQNPLAATPRSMGLSAVEASRRYLVDYAELYRTSKATLGEAKLNHVHDTGRGAIIATFGKKVDGKPVFRDEIHVVMDRELRLVALTGYVTPHDETRGLRWNLARNTALAIAFSDLTGQATLASRFAEVGFSAGDYRHLKQVLASAEGEHLLLETARVKDVLFGLENGLVPAYYVELNVGRAAETEASFYSYVISAVDGRLLFRRNLTDRDSYSYRVWAETTGDYVPHDGPMGTVGTPHPTGNQDGYQAPFIAPNLVTLAASPFSQSATDHWLGTGATETDGNNVDAYADHFAPDGFTSGQDVRATPNGPNTFDYTYDTANLNPTGNSTQIQAAVTQLFYDINFFHDWYYDHGFDELAGNAQHSNYGRGGLESDRIKGEAQDNSGFNNANMSTPADGSRPRMQMYMWNYPGGIKVTVNSPPSIAGDYAANTAGWGPTLFDVTADFSYPQDTSGAYTGCNAFAPGSLTGRIAIIDRGVCAFTIKVENAQAAGAAGVIIANNATGPAPGLGGVPTQPITIGTLSVTQADGNTLKGALASGPVNGRLLRSLTARDGTIDNGIVAHEWGHYISNRLIGDASGLSNKQGRSMGEGWADFHALLMMVRDQDRSVPSNANFGGVYSASVYAFGGFDPDTFYWGIRRYPYSVDLNKNPLTFKMIENGIPLPTTAPVAFGQSGVDNSEVHNSGEVWCSMLWEGYVSLLNATQRYTFAQAQDAMKDYLIAGYKATPNSPTFLEARDALLAAVYASSAQDFPLFAAGFAKRGAGIGAVAPPRLSTTHIPTVESFLTGNDVKFAVASLNDNQFYCDHDGFLDDGETGVLFITLKNTGHGTLNGLTAQLTSTTPGVTFANNGQVTFSSVTPFGTATGAAQVTLTGATAPTPISIEISYDDPTLVVPGPYTQTVEFLGNFDDAPATSATDDAESTLVAWTAGFDPTLSGSELFERLENGVQDHVFWGPNPGAPADITFTSPPLNVDPTASFGLTFKHRYDFEYAGTQYFDGAIMEITTDGGATWTKIPDTAFTAGGYNVTLLAGGSNPLNGQLGFGARSAGYPAFITSTLDFGTTYAGQTVQLRFRVGADDNTAGAGWELDDLAFTGITNTPFPTVITDPGVCINRPPVAVVGPDQTADERTQVVLDGSLSTDPDGDTLTYLWTQSSGPQVTFTAPGTFVAPEVKDATELTFSLVVSDGQYISQAVTTRVTVNHVNRNPTAVVAKELTVEERTPGVVLDGAQSFDIDGDTVTWAWSQQSGPSITLDDPTSAAPTFTAPEVMADSTATFQLVVSDGALSSAPVQLTVVVKQVNRSPAITVTPQADVEERTSVTLTAIATDADAEDAKLYLWTQTDGPEAHLETTDAASLTFTAPDVPENTPVTFKVTVYDGDETREDRLEAEGEVTFTVKQVNRAPVANAGPDRRIPPQTSIQLGHSGTQDPDGDELTYTWKQVAGTTVELRNATTGSPTFTAPAITADEDFTFELVVSDGELTSEKDSVTVTVSNTTSAGGCGCNAGEGGFAGMGAILLMGALTLLGRKRRLL